MKEYKGRNNWLDVLKGLACFGIVMVHFTAQNYSDTFTIMIRSIGRTGLPLFFMISGYLVGIKEVEKHSAWFLRQIKKILTYYLVFSLVLYAVYAAYDLASGKGRIVTMQFKLSLERIFTTLIGGQTILAGHLWYFGAYAGCLFVFWCASHVKWGYSALAVCSPVFLVMYYILGRYSRVVFDRKFPVYYPRNFLFVAIPMFACGFFIPRMKQRIIKLKSNMLMLILLCVLCLVFEAWAFGAVPEYDVGSHEYFFNTVLAFLILYFVTGYDLPALSEDNFWVCVGRKYSLYIYVFQYFAARLCNYSITFSKKYTSTKIFATMYQYGRNIFVFIVALLIGILCYHIEQWISKKMRKGRA